MTGPSLECANQNDRFTVNETMTGRLNGNAALTYPVALLTSDELMLAGNGHFGNSSSSTYLVTQETWWTMSPCDFSDRKAFVIREQSGYTTMGSVPTNVDGVRPSISLKHNMEIEGDGDGSINNPFIIKQKS